MPNCFLQSVINVWVDKHSCPREFYAWDLPAEALFLLYHCFGLSSPVSLYGNELPSYLHPRHQCVVAPRPYLIPISDRHLLARRSALMVAHRWQTKPWFWVGGSAGHAQPLSRPPQLSLTDLRVQLWRCTIIMMVQYLLARGRGAAAAGQTLLGVCSSSTVSA